MQQFERTQKRGVLRRAVAETLVAEEPRPVTQEDFDKMRSVYDKKIAEQTKQLEDANTATKTSLAEIALLKEGADADTLKSIEREKALRAKELLFGENEKSHKATDLRLAARELALEAKSAGVEVNVDELVKLGDKGAMAIEVLHLTTKSKVLPPKPGAKPLPPYGQPTTVRYPSTTAVMENFLRENGVV